MRKLIEVQAKYSLDGLWHTVVINPSAIGHVTFPDCYNTSTPNTRYVKLGLGSSAEYLISEDTWRRLIHIAGIDLEVIV